MVVPALFAFIQAAISLTPSASSTTHTVCTTRYGPQRPHGIVTKYSTTTLSGPAILIVTPTISSTVTPPASTHTIISFVSITSTSTPYTLISEPVLKSTTTLEPQAKDLQTTNISPDPHREFRRRHEKREFQKQLTADNDAYITEVSCRVLVEVFPTTTSTAPAVHMTITATPDIVTVTRTSTLIITEIKSADDTSTIAAGRLHSRCHTVERVAADLEAPDTSPVEVLYQEAHYSISSVRSRYACCAQCFGGSSLGRDCIGYEYRDEYCKMYRDDGSIV